MNAIEWSEWLDKDYGVAPCNKPELAGLLRCLHAENERLTAENEAMAKDAARYVWIRDQHQYSSRGWEIVQEVDREGWDEAIDAAMEQSK